MKKILLSLFLIVTSIEVSKLNAYCVYNRSQTDKLEIQIFPSKKASQNAPLFGIKARHKLKPNGGKACWNWKKIDPKNRKKVWYWVAYKRQPKFRIGEGYFPIGSAIVFKEYDASGKAIFNIHFGPNPKSMPLWNYRESPWNYRSQPWKTYKR